MHVHMTPLHVQPQATRPSNTPPDSLKETGTERVYERFDGKGRGSSGRSGTSNSTPEGPESPDEASFTRSLTSLSSTLAALDYGSTSADPSPAAEESGSPSASTLDDLLSRVLSPA